MHANVIRIRYKSGEDLEKAVEGVKGIVGNIEGLPGLQAFHFIRLAQDESIHWGVFDTADHAGDAREKMLPRLRDVVMPHAKGEPEVKHGPVMIHKSQ